MTEQLTPAPPETDHRPWCTGHIDATGTCSTTRTAGGLAFFALADPGRAPEVYVGGDTPTDLAGLDDLIAALTALRGDLTHPRSTP